MNRTAIVCAISGSFLKWNQATFCPRASCTVKVAACSATRHGRGKRPVISSGLPRPSTSRAITRAASAPEIILPICAGRTDFIIFRAEFVNLAEGFRASNTLSHTVRVRLEHRWRFHDGDADRTAGVATNQQEVRHVLTALPGSIALYGQAGHREVAAAIKRRRQGTSRRPKARPFFAARRLVVSLHDLHTARDFRNTPPDNIRHAGFYIRAERTLAPVRQFFGGVR
jgi:hypothetical protein